MRKVGVSHSTLCKVRICFSMHVQQMAHRGLSCVSVCFSVKNIEVTWMNNSPGIEGFKIVSLGYWLPPWLSIVKSSHLQLFVLLAFLFKPSLRTCLSPYLFLLGYCCTCSFCRLNSKVTKVSHLSPTWAFFCLHLLTTITPPPTYPS